MLTMGAYGYFDVYIRGRIIATEILLEQGVGLDGNLYGDVCRSY